MGWCHHRGQREARVKYGIIIPTRDRFDLLAKTVPHWLEQDLPIVLMVEYAQLTMHRSLVRENGWPIKVYCHQDSGRGVGYARHSCVDLAAHYGLDAFLMVDDDTRPTKGDARRLLKFVASGKAMAAAAWMPNYGLWFPNGNALAKEPNLCIPRPSGPDRTIALNVELVKLVGNYDMNIDVWCDNAELNRCGIKGKQLWYVHTGLHIKSLNKHNDPGGCFTYMEQQGTDMAVRMKKLHTYVYHKWGERYINDPSKSRMITQWQKMYTDFIGPKCAAAVKAVTVYEDKAVKPAWRMFA